MCIKINSFQIKKCFSCGGSCKNTSKVTLCPKQKKKIQTFLDLIFKPKTIAQVNNPLSVCEELLLVVLDPYITKHRLSMAH